MTEVFAALEVKLGVVWEHDASSVDFAPDFGGTSLTLTRISNEHRADSMGSSKSCCLISPPSSQTLSQFVIGIEAWLPLGILVSQSH